MDRRGHPKPKITRSWGFRVEYQPQGYECLEVNGSLKVGCRRLLYCPDCDAPECIWGGPTFKQVQAGAKREEEKCVTSGARFELFSQASKRNSARKRARGLAPSGKPLAQTCWNCACLRLNGHNSFICKFRPLDRPVSEWVVRKRTAERLGCQSFDMRLAVKIARL